MMCMRPDNIHVGNYRQTMHLAFCSYEAKHSKNQVQYSNHVTFDY